MQDTALPCLVAANQTKNARQTEQVTEPQVLKTKDETFHFYIDAYW